MATFIATTACNGPRVTDAEAVKKIMDRYSWDGDTTAGIIADPDDGQPRLTIAGYDWPAAWKVPDGVDRTMYELDYDTDPNVGFEQFLKQVAPFLAEPLTVQAIGFENCRFPLAACKWHVLPGGGAIEIWGFQHSFHEDAVQ